MMTEKRKAREHNANVRRGVQHLESLQYVLVIFWFGPSVGRGETATLRHSEAFKDD